MITRIEAIRVCALTALFALAACSSEAPRTSESSEPNINLLRKSDAVAFMLEHIDLSGEEPVEVKLYNEMLAPNQRVSELGTDYAHTAKNHEWFAIVDRFPGAYFPHPVDYVFLDYLTQEVEISPRRHVPLVNGTLIWPTLAQYQMDLDVIFSRTKPEQGLSIGMTFPSKPASETTTPLGLQLPSDSEDSAASFPRRYALLLHNASETDTFMKEIALANVSQMASALKANGFEVQEYTADHASNEREPSINIGRESGYGLYQLRHFIKKHQDDADRYEEIFIYLTGKTDLENGPTKDRTFFEISFPYSGEKADRPAQHRFYAEDLVDLLRPLASRRINVVIDSNFSGGFVDVLRHLGSVETVVSSCGPRELAYTSIYDAAGGGDIKDPYGKIQGETGSEFTSGFSKGLIDLAKGETPSPKPKTTAQITAFAYASAIRNDIAAIANQTHPIGYSRYDDR